MQDQQSDTVLTFSKVILTSSLSHVNCLYKMNETNHGRLYPPSQSPHHIIPIPKSQPLTSPNIKSLPTYLTHLLTTTPHQQNSVRISPPLPSPHISHSHPHHTNRPSFHNSKSLRGLKV